MKGTTDFEDAEVDRWPWRAREAQKHGDPILSHSKGLDLSTAHLLMA